MKQSVGNIRARVFRQMLATRSWKYKSFLRYLRLFRYASLSHVRGEFLESYYVLMRYLDDVVDGDVPLPEGYDDESDYLIGKLDFIKQTTRPNDEIDQLILHCFQLAEKMNKDFGSETEDIINSLLFDAQRKGQLKIFPKAVLQKHFHAMDIRGTIRATLKIFNEDPDKYLFLEPLGMASRFQYDIEDFESDIETGYINISLEECAELGISSEDFSDLSSPKFSKWLQKHALEGLNLLHEHEKNLKTVNFSFLARATFPFVYTRPAKKVFLKTLEHFK